MTDDVVVDTSADLIIKAGYDDTFSTQTGTSVIAGNLTLRCGAAIVDGLTIQ